MAESQQAAVGSLGTTPTPPEASTTGDSVKHRETKAAGKASGGMGDDQNGQTGHSEDLNHQRYSGPDVNCQGHSVVFFVERGPFEGIIARRSSWTRHLNNRLRGLGLGAASTVRASTRDSVTVCPRNYR